MQRSVPTRVEIPALGVHSALMGLGLQTDGTLEVPPGAFPAGWYTGSPTPGELGPAVIVGHVHYNGAAGVFARLGSLEPADLVLVTRKDGSRAAFRVSRVEEFDKAAFPTRLVYGNIGNAGLRLITCGGLDLSSGDYEDNVVVFADLVDPRGATES